MVADVPSQAAAEALTNVSEVLAPDILQTKRSGWAIRDVSIARDGRDGCVVFNTM